VASESSPSAPPLDPSPPAPEEPADPPGPTVAQLLAYNEGLSRAYAARVRGYMAIMGVYRCPSALPRVPCAILFSYEDRMVTQWHRFFEEAAELADDGAVLVVPTIGTNNRMTFFQSAICIFTAIRACLQREDSAMRRLREVRVVTPWAADALSQSTRTVQHLFNLMDLHGQENTCLVCCVSKVEVLLPCGHRITCEQCALSIYETMPLCPLCRRRFEYSQIWRTPKLEDCSRRLCCEANGEKEKKVMVPCGCVKTCCASCAEPFPVRCPSCNALVSAYVPIFEL